MSAWNRKLRTFFATEAAGGMITPALIYLSLNSSGAALTLGASTHISGNFLVTAGTTIGASSTVNGRILSQDAVTLGASVVLTS